METSNTVTKKSGWAVSVQKAVAYLYFFFNSVGLKGGLLYTNLLSPFFLVWIYKKGYIKFFLYSLLAILPFSVVHYLQGVDLKSFLISHTLFFSTILFVISSYIYVSSYKSLKDTLHKLLVLNFILVLIALPFYFMEYRFQKLFWYTNLFTTQKTFTRLSLMTFEASYYALLLIPIAYYFLFKVGFDKELKNRGLIMVMVLLPFVLSMSFGVLGGSLIAALLMIWFNRHRWARYKNAVNILGVCIFLMLAALLVLLVLFPNSLPATRISNIFMGYDTSTRGRTVESFEIAWLVAKSKSVWFGCGLGQAKFILPDIIHQHFPHWGQVEVYRIPNALAETFAIFGVFGVVVRFALILYFFIKTKVNTNYLRLSLFLFIFIYQFTGSYITNVVEYMIWIFAFTDVFPEFNAIKWKGLSQS